MNAEYVTISEVAGRLRTSKMTIYRLVSTGEIKAIRVGRSFRIPTAALEEFIQCAEIDPAKLAGVGDE